MWLDMSSAESSRTGCFFENYKQLDIQSTLNFVAAQLEATIYLEDIDGDLLFASDQPKADSWRECFSVFCSPSALEAPGLLSSWRASLGMYSLTQVVLSVREHHLVMPVTFRGELFAFVHFVSTTNTQMLPRLSDHQFLKEIGDKIYMVVMGELSHVASTAIHLGDAKRELEEQHRSGRFRYLVVAVDFPQRPRPRPKSGPLDDRTLMRRAVQRLIACAYQDRKYFLLYRVFIRKQHLGFVLAFDSKCATKDCSVLQDQLRSVLKANPEFGSASMAFSFEFESPLQLAAHFEQAVNVLKLGQERLPHLRVYSSAQAGIRELLIPLLATPEVKSYAEQVLAPLEKDVQLLDTLVVFLQENGNVARTGNQMFLSRRAVAYRLRRVRNALGRDIGDAETVFLLQVCLRANGLLGSPAITVDRSRFGGHMD